MKEKGMTNKEMFEDWLKKYVKSEYRTERFTNGAWKVALEDEANGRKFELEARFTMLGRPYIYTGEQKNNKKDKYILLVNKELVKWENDKNNNVNKALVNMMNEGRNVKEIWGPFETDKALKQRMEVLKNVVFDKNRKSGKKYVFEDVEIKGNFGKLKMNSLELAIRFDLGNPYMKNSKMWDSTSKTGYILEGKLYGKKDGEIKSTGLGMGTFLKESDKYDVKEIKELLKDKDVVKKIEALKKEFEREGFVRKNENEKKLTRVKTNKRKI